MAKPIVHARSSVKRFGGTEDVYFPVHLLMDLSKSAHASVRHRVVFHSKEGIDLVRAVLGDELANGVPTAAVADQHVVEDVGWVPGVESYLAECPTRPFVRSVPMSVEQHAERDAARYGGRAEDYVLVHAFVDSFPQIVLHHAFGCFVAEMALGTELDLSSGGRAHVRDVVEKHVIRDLGTLPDLGDWVSGMTAAPWMAGARRQPARVE